MADAWGLRAGRLFDGERFTDASTLVVQDNRVVEITSDPGALPVTDLGDEVTLLPGLVDAHVHLTFNGTPTCSPRSRSTTTPSSSGCAGGGGREPPAGVTTVRDLGDRASWRLESRARSPSWLPARRSPRRAGTATSWAARWQTGWPMLAAVTARAEAGCPTSR